jgi:outer membrane biosynthesis protein TonB
MRFILQLSALLIGASFGLSQAAEPASDLPGKNTAWPEQGAEWEQPVPQLTEKGAPGDYPIYAQTFGLEGSATVGFIIDRSGRLGTFLLLGSAPAGVCLSAAKEKRRHIKT